jgi:hypothetical protein
MLYCVAVLGAVKTGDLATGEAHAQVRLGIPAYSARIRLALAVRIAAE